MQLGGQTFLSEQHGLSLPRCPRLAGCSRQYISGSDLPDVNTQLTWVCGKSLPTTSRMPLRFVLKMGPWFFMLIYKLCF